MVLALFRSNKKNPQTSNFKVISTSDNADTEFHVREIQLNRQLIDSCARIHE